MYEGLGEFVVQFELIVFSMREALTLLWSRGGPPKFQQLVRPGLAELTADPMVRIFQASFAEAVKTSGASEAEKSMGNKILAAICNRMRKLIKARNEIVHGTWFIGYAAPEDIDFSVADGHKAINNKYGVEHRDISRTRQDFDALSDECNEVNDLINRFFSTVLFGRSVCANFVCDGKDGITLESHLWTFRRRSANADQPS